MSQQSRVLPVSAGVKWFKLAFEATRREPITLMGVVLCYILSMSFLSVLPYVGPVFAALFMPFGTVFIGLNTRDVLRGKSPSFAMLPELWRDPSVRQSLIRIGLVFGFILITVNALYGFLAADDIARWTITENDRLDWASVRANWPWTATVAMLVVYIPGLMAVWFAPLLASELHMSCGKSLFYSFFGVVRNLGPILCLLALLFAFTVGISVVSVWLVYALELNSSAFVILTPIAFLLSTFLYASYWPMYADLFDDVARE